MTIEPRRLVELPLTGARIRQARWNPGGHTFELLLRCQDPERGPLDLLLRYRGVRSLEPALPALATLVEDVDLAVQASAAKSIDGLPEHRLALTPAGEIVVRFTALESSETLGTGGDYGDHGFRFQILSC